LVTVFGKLVTVGDWEYGNTFGCRIWSSLHPDTTTALYLMMLLLWSWLMWRPNNGSEIWFTLVLIIVLPSKSLVLLFLCVPIVWYSSLELGYRWCLLCAASLPCYLWRQREVPPWTVLERTSCGRKYGESWFLIR
jgi:hypothetical protein